MKAIRVIVMLLVIIGALNWGLIGFFNYDLIADLFGGYGSTGARTVFSIVGIAGLIAALRFISKCCGCKSCCGGGSCGSGSCGGGSCRCGNPNCNCKKQ
jgi:uncharacterized membrane protein YuzA (DUF378 family)